jgi:hypothetical protein
MHALPRSNRRPSGRRLNLLGPFESLEAKHLLATVELLPSQDNSLFEDSAEQLSNGAGDYLFIGRVAPRENGTLRRALLKFDVGTKVPQGATIVKATLGMTMTKTISGAKPATLHRLSAAWGEGGSDAPDEEGGGTEALPGDATWTHAVFPSTRWQKPGGDFAATATATASVADEGRYTWNSSGMASDVTDWLADPTSNFGWIVRGDEVTLRSAKRFNSRENSDGGSRPVLTIEYEMPVELPTLAFGPAVALDEGNSGTTAFVFAVTLSAAPTAPVTVNYATSPVTATSGVDFQPANGTLTFQPGGPTSQNVVVNVVGDLDVEPDETFQLVLSNAAGAVLPTASSIANGTIVNDDEPLTQHPWQNATLPEDVDNSGQVVPLDALLVINELNTVGGGTLPVPPTADWAPPPFLDVNGDNFLSPIDALLVINFLNQAAAAEGEPADPFDQADWLADLAASGVAEARRSSPLDEPTA